MNAEVPLSSFLRYRKGKPPRGVAETGQPQLPVLSPEYLRGAGEPELTASVRYGVPLDGDEIILLWDGSNAGEFFRAKRGLLASTMVAFDFDETEILKDYLFWELKRFEPLLKALTSGSGIPHVDKQILLSHRIRKPQRPAQVKIAEVLSAMERAIEQTEALIAKYQRIKTGLMQDLLTCGIDEHDRLRNPATHKFNPSAFGPIPMEWDVMPLGACVKKPITYGIVQAGPHIPGGVPYIRTGDMDGEELVRERMLCTSRVIADSYKRSEVKTREIICAIRATIGKVLPVPDHLDGANLTQGTARISPREGIDGRFLLWAIRSAKTQREISLQSKGTTFAEITLADLRRTPVAVPRSFAEQKQVAESLDAIDGMIAQETTGLSKLQRLKTGLMQDLLTGRVSVEPLLKPQTTG